MAADEWLVTRVRFALDVRFGTWCFEPPASSLDFSACSRADLLFGIFLARVSNSRIDWASWNSSRRRIPASAGRAVRTCGLLVCADAAMVFQQLVHADGNFLGGNDCLAAAGFEFLATRHARGLFRMLSLVRERGAGFFGISVRWNVAGGGVYRAVFRPGRIPAGVG